MIDRAALRRIFDDTRQRLTTGRHRLEVDSLMPSEPAIYAFHLLDALRQHEDQDEVVIEINTLVGEEHRKPLLRAVRSEDLVSTLQNLEQDLPLIAACAAFVAALTDQQTAAAITQSMQAHGNIINPQQVFADHYYEASFNNEHIRQQRALITYLENTAQVCNVLSLGPLDQTDAAHRSSMELTQVYINLNTTSARRTGRGYAASGRPHRRRGQHQKGILTALEALAHAKNHRLMLLGVPGSGKSTFVNHLTYWLAREKLAELRGESINDAQDFMTKLPEWSLGLLLPVRIILRDFAAFVATVPTQNGSMALLCEFLRKVLEESDCADAFDLIRQHIEDGKALFLLDGLDEVVNEKVIPCVAESINSAARHYPHTPLLVTCRVNDYQLKWEEWLSFSSQTLANFTEDQILQFVRAWYTELAESGRRSQVQEDIKALQQTITTRPELRDLARLPMLATVMALVHTNRGKLPDSRSLLYYECIDILLLRWRQQSGENDLLTRLELPQFRSDNLLALMARLGFAAHKLAERNMGSDTNLSADLNEHEVIRLLAEGFEQYHPERKNALAEIVLNALARGNGLLLKRGPDTYAFPHRTFQEFLAGYHLLNLPNYLTHCLAHSTNSHWHEALKLLVGYQVLAGREYDKPLSLVRELLVRSPVEQVLAGELLHLMGRERLACYDSSLLEHKGVWRQVHNTLRELATRGVAPSTPAPLRAHARFVTGDLCTYNAPDSLAPLFDPFLPLATIGLPPQKHRAWRKSLEHYWCHVPAGTFWYGDDDHKDGLQQVELPYSFQIARYPITNADFARFIAVEGYDNYQWWTTEGWRYRQGAGDLHLNIIGDASQSINPLQPVVSVTWYEAMAYCTWLTAQGHAQGWLPWECEIRLPTSLEWGRAARHTDKRRYPWGDDPPTPEHANYDKTDINAPAPIGCFPRGAAVCGAQDMVGNVLEWLASTWSNPRQIKPECDLSRNKSVLLSWSGFWHDSTSLYCGRRLRFNPHYAYVGGGFRIVCSVRNVGE